MAVSKTITIDDRPVTFKASAAIPRMYRNMFQRDIYLDFNEIQEKMAKNNPNASTLPMETLEAFENIAYTMAKHGDPSIPDSIDEWLDGFSMFTIYSILPEIVELWEINNKTDATAKKKTGQ